jgi:hypothetical protein
VRRARRRRRWIAAASTALIDEAEEGTAQPCERRRK